MAIKTFSKRTTTNDLDNLVEKEVFEKVGTRGRGTFYRIKRAIIGQKRIPMSDVFSIKVSDVVLKVSENIDRIWT